MSSFKLIELLFPTPVVETVKPPAVFKPSLLISGVNTSDCVQLLINAETFVLGKDEDCNGRLDFNTEISRHHCEIIWRDGLYYVKDRGSTNHTYLNDIMLAPGTEYPLEAGDRLQLSTSVFTVEEFHQRGDQA